MGQVLTKPTRRKVPKWLLPAVGYTISIASLIWVFAKFPYQQLGQDVRTLEWRWVMLSIVFNLAVYVCQAWKWALILSPAEQPPLWRCVQAIFVGLFASDVLPAHAGEIIRCYLLTFWEEVPISLALTSALIERILDGLILVAAFFAVTANMPNIPPWLNRSTSVLGICLVAIAAAFLYILFRKSHAHSVVSGHPWLSKFVHVLDELHNLGEWRTLSAALGVSVLYIVLQALSVWALLKADDFDLSIVSATVVLVIVRIGTLIPNAPANLGSYQFFCVFAMRLLGVENNNAKIFSTIMFWGLTIPPLIGGAVAVALTGLNLGEIRHHAHHAHRRRFEAIQTPAPEN
ncbi:MAG: flippase-like domain-containing protein [Acidobacteriota bacterium]|nr:flippase-like domain-containing protein [Acidobacteriota bacterium]